MALARALVNRPRVLLLDEPLGALDLKLREAMQDELKALQARLGITFVFVTHDQGEALSMADRVAVFNAGRIAQVGTPQEIYDRPRTRFVADFVGSANVLPPALAARFGADGLGEPPPRGAAARRRRTPPSPAPSPPPATSAPAPGSAVDVGGAEIALVAPAGTRGPRARRPRRPRLGAGGAHPLEDAP